MPVPPKLIAALLALLLLAAAPLDARIVVAARPIARGALIVAADLAVTPAQGLVLGALADPDQAIGMTARRSLAAGVAVRADALAAPAMVRRGDPVTLSARGRGFSVEATGAASSDGTQGQSVAAVNSATGARLRGAVSGEGIISLRPLNPGGDRRNPER